MKDNTSAENELSVQRQSRGETLQSSPLLPDFGEWNPGRMLAACAMMRATVRRIGYGVAVLMLLFSVSFAVFQPEANLSFLQNNIFLITLLSIAIGATTKGIDWLAGYLLKDNRYVRLVGGAVIYVVARWLSSVGLSAMTLLGFIAAPHVIDLISGQWWVWPLNSLGAVLWALSLYSIVMTPQTDIAWLRDDE